MLESPSESLAENLSVLPGSHLRLTARLTRPPTGRLDTEVVTPQEGRPPPEGRGDGRIVSAVQGEAHIPLRKG